MTEDEKRMFGMSKNDIREQYLESITARCSGLEMVVMGILSDCQELNRTFHEGKEAMVGKQLNIAKFILCEMMDRRESEETVLVNSDGKEIA